MTPVWDFERRFAFTPKGGTGKSETMKMRTRESNKGESNNSMQLFPAPEGRETRVHYATALA